MFSNIKRDIPASFVVFLVALPLCLGIALASGAPLLAGVIGGVIGGIVVGLLSGSQIGVTGPAAGLTVIVLSAITDNFLSSVFFLSSSSDCVNNSSFCLLISVVRFFIRLSSSILRFLNLLMLIFDSLF